MDLVNFDPDAATVAKAPKRRPDRAQPAETIPPAINFAFLEALASERAVSVARDLAIGFSGATETAAEARRAVWGHPSEPLAAAVALP